MKAEKVLGFAVCAFACTMGSAFANTTNGWFGVKVENSEIAHPNCETNGVAVSIEDGKIKLDNDKSSPFVVTNFTAASTSDGIVKITATACLTPSSTNDFTEVITSGATAGFAVGIDGDDKTNFYGYANGAWHKLQGDPVELADGDGNTTFSLLLNYRDNVVSFYVDSYDGILGTETFGVASGSSLNGINAYGNGSITSITGGYEVAVAAYNNKKYGSIAQAVEAAGEGGKSDVQYVDPSSGNPQTAGATADNGLNLVICEALGLPTNDATANIAVAPVETDDDENLITLKVNIPVAASEPGVVQYQVKNSGDVVKGTYDAEGIKIPLEAGTYTITPVLK